MIENCNNLYPTSVILNMSLPVKKTCLHHAQSFGNGLNNRDLMVNDPKYIKCEKNCTELSWFLGISLFFGEKHSK